MDYKNLSPAINNLVISAVLASRKDIEANYEGDNKYILMETLEQFQLSKDDPNKPDNKSFATLAPPSKQILGYLFTTIVKETNAITEAVTNRINTIGLSDAEREAANAKYADEDKRANYISQILLAKQVAYVVQSCVEYNDLCVTQFMYSFVQNTNLQNSNNLSALADREMYFKQKIQLATKRSDIWVSALNNLWIQFIKCFAKRACAIIWEDHGTINEKIIRSILRENDAPEELLAALTGCITEMKAVSKAKTAEKKAKASTSTIVVDAAAAAAANNTPVATPAVAATAPAVAATPNIPV